MSRSRDSAGARANGSWARAARRTASLAAGFVLLVGPITGAVVAATTSAAGAQGSELVQEPFTSSPPATTDWALPGSPNGVNSACLTAGTEGVGDGSPIPGCTDPALNGQGSGALELTSPEQDEEGGVAYTLSVPSTDGIDATFDAAQYGGTDPGADGIGFFLAAANPADPEPPTTIGQAGGSLGYSAVPEDGAPGMAYGYLGIGLDVYGNYANSTYEGTGCTGPEWDTGNRVPDSVSVRGPGNGTAGYCMLNSTAATYTSGGFGGGTLDGGPQGSRSSATVPVEVVINPSSAAIGTDSGLSVPADSYEVAFTPIGGSQQIVSGVLPQVSSSLGFPASWIDPFTGLPYQFTFGWVGSTGGSDDYHDVWMSDTSTVTGTPPKLSAALSDDASGSPGYGSTMDYDVTVSNAAGTSTDSGPISVTDTVPSGETPLASGLGQNGWDCDVPSGQTVTCQWSGSLDSGDSLPTLVIPVQVTGTPGTVLEDTAEASSDDSDPATGSDSVTVEPGTPSLSVSTSPSVTTYGFPVALIANLLPETGGGIVGPTGQVGFTDLAHRSGICSATISNGTGSCSTGVLPAATYDVGASYGGDSNWNATGSGTYVYVEPASTSFTVAANPLSTGYGSTVQLSETGLAASGQGVAPTGIVTYKSGGTTLCTATLPATSCTTGVLAPGSYVVTASYPGDNNYQPSTSSTGFTIALESTTLSASATPTSTTYGNTVQLSASGLPKAGTGVAAATGTVTFSYDGTTLCSAAVSAGAASCYTGVLAVGTYPVDVSYSGDSNYSSSSTTTSFTITKASTSLSASSSPSSVTYGTTVGLSGTLAPAGATGTVTFASGSLTLCTASVVPPPPAAAERARVEPRAASTGQTVAGEPVECSTGVLPVGTYSVTATYSGDGNHLGSTATTSFTVSLAPTTVTASASPPSPDYGNTVELAASNLPAGGSGVQAATGTVTFTSGGSTLCVAPVYAGGASCPTAVLPVGAYSVTAEYSGDALYASSSTSTSFTIEQAPTGVAASADPSETAYGNTVELSASSLPTGGDGASAATGTVTFSAGQSTLCTAVVLEGGASCDTAVLPAGQYSVTAAYSGDSNYSGSSTTTGFTIDQASTSFTAAAAPGSTAHPNTVLLTATGLPSDATGSVSFADGDTPLCSGTVSGGFASCTTQPLDAGTYPVTGTYSGDSNYLGSTATTSFSITQAETAFTAAAVPGSIDYGNTVGLDATGLPSDATGTVTFTTGSTTLCTAEVADGAAECESPVEQAGTYVVLASYSGDLNYLTSTATTSFTIVRAPAPFTASATPVADVYPSPVTLTASGLPAAATGTVTFSSGSTTLCSASALHGSATCRVSRADGAYPVEAAYSGDRNFLPSTARTGFTVDGGFWLTGSDGGVFSFGGARFSGSTWVRGFDTPLNGKVVGIAPSAGGLGYWLVTSEGQVLDFGDAASLGDLFTIGKAGTLRAPVVGIAATPDGGGYWLVAADGGVFGFGDAHFHGNTYTIGKESSLAAPVVGMAATPDGGGYWLVAGDGGLFAFGDAHFEGNAYTDGEAGHLAGSVVGIASSPDGLGYRLATSEGQVLTFGDARGYGDIQTVGLSGSLRGPIVGIVAFPHPVLPPIGGAVRPT